MQRGWDGDEDPLNLDDLIELVETQRDAVKAVATGAAIDRGREREYRARAGRIATELKRLGLRDPFQWPDLQNFWAWAKQWSTYHERREAVDQKICSVLERLGVLAATGQVDDWGGAPGHWAELDERLTGLRYEIDSAMTLDDYQDVGRRGREILIAAVNEMFEDDMVPEGVELPKSGDAKARFDYAVAAYSPGRGHAELRKLMRSAWDLNQKVTHGESGTRVHAFASAQATVLIVRTLAEMHSLGRPSARSGPDEHDFTA